MVKTENRYCFPHDGKHAVFMGIFLFILGLVVWAGKIGLYSEELTWANILMVAGILFAFKGIFVASKK